ncbi:hypothetical protein A2U01_0115459, partial [Trifolium medium]|nr:hypothetical protein [Trifolium medium]
MMRVGWREVDEERWMERGGWIEVDGGSDGESWMEGAMERVGC